MTLSSLRLSVVIPKGPGDDRRLKELLSSLKKQTLPADSYEVLIETDGNSEEAKAHGILKAQAPVVALFCTDNVLRDDRFLEDMLRYAEPKDVVGAYTAQYDYVLYDKPLSRYFALMGGNDPLCWFLGKNDRYDYLKERNEFLVERRNFLSEIPSIGDNGFLAKTDLMRLVASNPKNHFCIDAIEDLRRMGHTRFNIVWIQKLWHKSGESLLTYLKKRYYYTRDLYWRDLAKRRWIMVQRKDWPKVVLFVLMSFTIVPHLVTAFKGYQRVKDPAWFLHPAMCLALTILYGWLFLIYRLPRLLFRHWKDPRASDGAWIVS